jgi:hypothetical protein
MGTNTAHNAEAGSAFATLASCHLALPVGYVNSDRSLILFSAFSIIRENEKEAARESSLAGS